MTDTPERDVVERLRDSLFAHIKHGDDAHKEWLRVELGKFFELAVRPEFTSLRAQLREARAALKPFADFSDPRGAMPDDFVITQGSSMARKQLTMGDCYRAQQQIGAETKP